MSAPGKRAQAFALALGLGLAPVLPVAAGAQGCNFDQVTAVGLLAAEFTEVTRNLRADPDAARILAAALPNLQRVFLARDREIMGLVGWSDLGEDFSRRTIEEAVADLERAARQGERQARELGQSYAWRIDSARSPLASYIAVEYLDSGRPYRDLAIDVIATARCLFSAKFSGPVTDTDPVWKRLEAELERLRDAAGAYGPVVYGGAGVPGYGLGLAALGVALAAGLGLFGLRLWRRRRF